MQERDLGRDRAIAGYFNSRIIFPFLDASVIKTAMGIHISEKINKEHKKIVLRKIAENVGIPEEFAWRKKRAAQYGSGFDNLIRRIAKAEGLSKTEWLSKM